MCQRDFLLTPESFALDNLDYFISGFFPSVEPRHTDPWKILHLLWHDFTKMVELSRTTTWYYTCDVLIIKFKFISLRFLEKYELEVNGIGFDLFSSFIQYHGGTNFGRSTGGPFIATSYDYDAPIDEYGTVLCIQYLNGSLFLN